MHMPYFHRPGNEILIAVYSKYVLQYEIDNFLCSVHRHVETCSQNFGKPFKFFQKHTLILAIKNDELLYEALKYVSHSPPLATDFA